MSDDRSRTARRSALSSSRVAEAAAACPLSSACSYLATAEMDTATVSQAGWMRKGRVERDETEAFEKKGRKGRAGCTTTARGRTELIRALFERDEVVYAHVVIASVRCERSAEGVDASSARRGVFGPVGAVWSLDLVDSRSRMLSCCGSLQIQSGLGRPHWPWRTSGLW